MNSFKTNVTMQCARLLLMCLFALALPAWALEPATIAQLEQSLAAAHGKSDKALAKQLGNLQLTERLSTVRLEKLQASLPGMKSRQALQLLSDASAFLNLPAAEIPQLVAPDHDTQSKLLSKTTNYIGQTLPRLPNFIATRSTTRFENLEVEHIGDSVAVVEDQPYHFINITRETVTYRNGAESVVASVKHPEHQRGLYNWGVFGPLLQNVVTDIFAGKMGWGHWEQGKNGTMAVFRYAVPQDRSHYDVKYCCFTTTNGWHTFETLPSYHGEIAVDPETGAILRLTIQTAIPAGHPIYRADILVEYGPVEIGGQQYICPTKSVSISRVIDTVTVLQAHCKTAGSCTSSRLAYPTTTSVNDAAYNSYHIFRAEVRILPTEASELKEEPPQSASPATPAPKP